MQILKIAYKHVSSLKYHIAFLASEGVVKKFNMNRTYVIDEEVVPFSRSSVHETVPHSKGTCK